MRHLAPFLRPASLAAAFILCVPALATNYTRSSKRGLVYVSNDHPADDEIWDGTNSDLTWYYNYAVTPVSAYENDTSFQYVPMLWGLPDESDTGSAGDFVTSVKNLLNDGMNITYVLGFNEPDGDKDTGGSDISPDDAADAWKDNLEPLRDLGIKLGAPAVTGSDGGFQWLSDFFDECDGGCTVDFMVVHWYGDFAGFASDLGQMRETYPKKDIWVTEWALPDDKNLTETQAFFNQSIDYLDGLDYVTRYSYFGSFRSSSSNVGADVAMLDQHGDLTDIGSWYIGGAETNNIPSAAGSIRLGKGESEWAWTAVMGIAVLFSMMML